MLWQLLIFIAVLSDAGAKIFQRISMKEKGSDPIVFAILFQLIAGLLLGVAWLITGITPQPIEKAMPNILFTPILFALANIFVFASLQKIEASVFTVLFTTRVIWIILGAVFLLGESFSFVQIVGTLLIISAVVLVSWQKSSFKAGRGILFALLAAFFLGTALANDALVVRYIDVLPYMVYAFLAPGLLTWVLYMKKTARILSTAFSANIIPAAVIGIFYAVSAMTYTLAYVVGKNAAQVGVLAQTGTIITVLLAFVFLHERTHWVRKLGAALLAFLGVLLVL